MAQCRARAITAVLVAGAALSLLAPAFVGAGAAPATGAPRAAVRRGALRATSMEGPEAPEAARLGGAVASLLAAMLVALVPVAEAQAARTGGRIGSSAPSKREQARPAPRAAVPPRIVNKTTIVNKTVVVPPPPPPVVVAPPPVISPFGMAAAPVIVAAPPPTLGDIIVGAAVNSAIHGAIASTVPHGPSVNDRIMENQIRQDERQLDRQAAQIEDLQREMRDLKK